MSDQPQETEMQESEAAAASAETRDALEAAIAANPAQVASFVERLGLVNELLDTTQLATSAMDDEMVKRLAGMSSLLMESADGLATEETAQLSATVGENADELDSALEKVLRLERAGTLDELADLADATTLLTSAMDDEMVMRLARTGSSLGEVAETAGDPDTVRGVETMLRAVGDAGGEPPEQLGTLGLLKSLRDPEVQRGMGFMVALARGIGGDLDQRDVE